MRRKKIVYDPIAKIYQREESEEDILLEIQAKLCYFNGIQMYRVRERIPDNRKRWQTLSYPGISDLIGVTQEGRAVFLEIKSRRGKVRPAQEVFLNDVKKNKAIAGVCRSWAETVALFAQHGITLRGF